MPPPPPPPPAGRDPSNAAARVYPGGYCGRARCPPDRLEVVVGQLTVAGGFEAVLNAQGQASAPPGASSMSLEAYQVQDWQAMGMVFSSRAAGGVGGAPAPPRPPAGGGH